MINFSPASRAIRLRRQVAATPTMPDPVAASAKDPAFNSLSLGKGQALGGGQSQMMSAIRNRRMNMYGGNY